MVHSSTVMLRQQPFIGTTTLFQGFALGSLCAFFWTLYTFNTISKPIFVTLPLQKQSIERDLQTTYITLKSQSAFSRVSYQHQPSAFTLRIQGSILDIRQALINTQSLLPAVEKTHESQLRSILISRAVVRYTTSATLVCLGLGTFFFGLSLLAIQVIVFRRRLQKGSDGWYFVRAGVSVTDVLWTMSPRLSLCVSLIGVGAIALTPFLVV